MVLKIKDIDESQAPLLDHLIELRARLMRFILALLVNLSLSGIGIFRTSYFLPVVIGLGTSSLLWVWMLNDQDRRMLKWIKAFNPFDLYSKGDAKPDAERALPFYRELVEEYLPGKLRW